MNNEKGKKKEVKVINVPKRKRPLATPSYIIRIFLIILFVCCILLLSSPFLNVTLYITDNLEITPSYSEAHLTLATQEEIDLAEQELQNAFQALETISSEQSAESKQEDSDILQSISSANYKWSYMVSKDVDIQSLAQLIADARNIDRSLYTSESIKTLNQALMNAQKTLCTSVKITQSAFQLALGGTIAESYGLNQTIGRVISHSIFALALTFVPLICFFALCFDRHRHIKHIICMIGAVVCLIDIFIALYPYVGIGAVLSVILYIIICILNIASIYAKQQEDYIISHPELEPEFTEKHPQFVKALINYKSFRKTAPEKSPANSKGKNSKKKK